MNTNELTISTVPINRKLLFGVPLSEVCTDDDLHPGLRDLFLKAYLNATNTSENDTNSNYMRKILSTGEEGQGSLDERLALKHNLENGNFIITIKTPPGAPIWVLRHFLGRLPKPLLFEFKPFVLDRIKFQWIELADDCQYAIELLIAENQLIDKLKLKLAAALTQLRNENYLVLSALMSLIRNLSVGNQTSSRLNKRVVFTLICYFTQALTIRPFRPGFEAHKDRRFYPLILLFIYYWPDIKNLVARLDKIQTIENVTVEKLRLCYSLPIFYRRKFTENSQQKSQTLKNNNLYLQIPFNRNEFKSTRNNYSESIIRTRIPNQLQEITLNQECVNCHSVNNIKIFVQLNVTPERADMQKRICISTPKITAQHPFKIEYNIKLNETEVNDNSNKNETSQKTKKAANSNLLIEKKSPKNRVDDDGTTDNTTTKIFKKINVSKIQQKLKLFSRKKEMSTSQRSKK